MGHEGAAQTPTFTSRKDTYSGDTEETHKHLPLIAASSCDCKHLRGPCLSPSSPALSSSPGLRLLSCRAAAFPIEPRGIDGFSQTARPQTRRPSPGLCWSHGWVSSQGQARTPGFRAPDADEAAESPEPPAVLPGEGPPRLGREPASQRWRPGCPHRAGPFAGGCRVTCAPTVPPPLPPGPQGDAKPRARQGTGASCCDRNLGPGRK